MTGWTPSQYNGTGTVSLVIMTMIRSLDKRGDRPLSSAYVCSMHNNAAFPKNNAVRSGKSHAY